MKKWVVGVVIVLVFLVLFFLGLRITGFVVTSINSCSDTDSGLVVSQKGTVWGEYYLLSREYYEETDYCIDEEFLVEFSCEGDYLDARRVDSVFKCSERCHLGACVGGDSFAQIPSVLERIVLFFKR